MMIEVIMITVVMATGERQNHQCSVQKISTDLEAWRAHLRDLHQAKEIFFTLKEISN